MRLTWRDAMATVLTAGIVALYAAFLVGEDLPLVSGARVLAGLILVVGLVACAVGSTAMTTGASTGLTVYIGGTLGAAAFLAALITNGHRRRKHAGDPGGCHGRAVAVRHGPARGHPDPDPRG